MEETPAMTRFETMRRVAKTNKLKGIKGGDCNVTQCQEPGASCYNEPMRAYYCKNCATNINKSSRETFGEPICKIKEDYTYDHEREGLMEALIKESPEFAGFAAVKQVVRGRDKIGRNDRCPCGSGKKYKKCHMGAKDDAR